MKAAVLLLAATIGFTQPMATIQRSYADDVRRSQWHLNVLRVSEAQKITKGDGVTVAVVDTGVDPHPDLAGNVLAGAVVDPRARGDGRSDSTGHGTAMAGLIAAHGHGSSDGALGIAPHSKILPVVDNAIGGKGDGDYTAAGIRWATEHGAHVINISSSGGHTPALEDAVRAAIAADVVVVASAGNRPGQRAVGFPAFYTGVLSVGATNRAGDIADVSVRGKQIMITAPGVDIMSTREGRGYGPGTGTSDSAAIVSGAVALVRSRFPDLTAAEVVHRLIVTATDRGPSGRDDAYGYGILDLVAALTAELPPVTQATPSTAPSRAAPPTGDGSVAGIVALVGAGVLIGGFILIVLARRHRGRRRRVP